MKSVLSLFIARRFVIKQTEAEVSLPWSGEDKSLKLFAVLANHILYRVIQKNAPTFKKLPLQHFFLFILLKLYNYVLGCVLVLVIGEKISHFEQKLTSLCYF